MWGGFPRFGTNTCKYPVAGWGFVAKKAPGGSVSVDPGATASKDFVPWFGSPDIVRRLGVSFAVSGYVRLVGETGAGKSTLVHTVDDVMNGGPFSSKTKAFYADKKHGSRALDDSFWKTYFGKPCHLYEYSLTQDTSRWDLVATQTLRNGSVEITPGRIMSWIQDQTPDTVKLLFLDEVNYAAPGVTSLFNELGDFRRSITVAEFAVYDMLEVEAGRSDLERELWGKRVRSVDHWMVTAENPYDASSYAGTSPPNIAQQNRPIPIDVPFMSQLEEIALLMSAIGGNQKYRGQVQDIVTIATQIRDKFKAHQLSFVLSPRNTKQLAQILSMTGDWDLVAATIVDWFPAQDKQEVRGIVGGKAMKV
jgi:MoxR-like ATPase